MLTTFAIVSALAAPLAAPPAISDAALASHAQTQRGDFRLRARLTGPGLASGKATYRQRDRNGSIRVRASVEIEDAAPDTTYDVALNGVVFAEITTNAFGFADLNLRGQANVPPMAAGDVIEVVGLVSGTLQER